MLERATIYTCVERGGLSEVSTLKSDNQHPTMAKHAVVSHGLCP